MIESNTGFKNNRARPEVELENDSRDVGSVKDLSTMRKALGPEVRREMKGANSSVLQLNGGSIRK